MKNQDFKDLISAWNALLAINDHIGKFTDGSCIEGGKFKDIYRIEDVIRRHSRYPKEDDDSNEKFCKILYNHKMTTEKKVELLSKKK